MTHDPFCYYSQPDKQDLWDVPEPCKDCERLTMARLHERQKVCIELAEMDDFAGASRALITQTILINGYKP